MINFDSMIGHEMIVHLKNGHSYKGTVGKANSDVMVLYNVEFEHLTFINTHEIAAFVIDKKEFEDE